MVAKGSVQINEEEKETVRLNLITIDKWIEHYTELWYNPNVPRKT